MRRLQTRLLVWFLLAIVLAVGSSVVTVALTSSDPVDAPTRMVSRHVQHRVARVWDDPRATDAYVAELRETTGLDWRVRRDPPQGLRPRGPNGLVFEDGVALLPIVKEGAVVGALELRTSSPPPRLWRAFAALAAALIVLGAVARRVSKRLSRPLEHLAHTAERFGSGDLAARTGMEAMPRRWVAEEVRDLARSFDGMAERISKVVVEQRELLAAISHELRSPLGRARVALEIARERTENDSTADLAPIRRTLEDADRQLVEIDAILGDLLSSARAGLSDLKLVETSLVSFVRERIALESRPIELGLGEGVEGATVMADVALLGRALHNVFANAWAHGHPTEAPLNVEISIADRAARVAVRDDGPGFAEDVLPRAFEPFVSGDGAARSPGSHGIGLGLTLVRRIVEAHGGSASARNLVEPAHGAEVTIELPLAAQRG